jgi:nitronate monooxygenase
MALAQSIKERLALPVVAAPMFLVSGPEIVIAACKAGVIGGFPSLNARTLEILDHWLQEITEALDQSNTPPGPVGPAPFAVNLIVHKTNLRAKQDLELITKYKAPIVITSVGHPGDIAEHVHSYGGQVFHDVINLRHARKAVEAGVDGIILVCAGAGGHAGLLNPFTFVPQVREFFDGTILLAGGISNGKAVRAAEVLGADLAYMGTRFIATKESMAEDSYKEMIVEAEAKDIVYTDKVSGINANFMVQSLRQAGMAPGEDNQAPEIEIGDDEVKAWKQIWSAGQGVGEISDVPTTQQLVERLKKEYEEGED